MNGKSSSWMLVAMLCVDYSRHLFFFSFDLAEKFRLCTSPSPDFLLLTIGEGRSAIERAADWLIPIISSHPTIINRLQPSASCFLLLRAYGVEGDKNRSLLELTAPLLNHASDPSTTLSANPSGSVVKPPRFFSSVARVTVAAATPLGKEGSA